MSPILPSERIWALFSMKMLSSKTNPPSRMVPYAKSVTHRKNTKTKLRLAVSFSMQASKNIFVTQVHYTVFVCPSRVISCRVFPGTNRVLVVKSERAGKKRRRTVGGRAVRRNRQLCGMMRPRERQCARKRYIAKEHIGDSASFAPRKPCGHHRVPRTDFIRYEQRPPRHNDDRHFFACLLQFLDGIQVFRREDGILAVAYAFRV